MLYSLSSHSHDDKIKGEILVSKLNEWMHMKFKSKKVPYKSYINLAIKFYIIYY